MKKEKINQKIKLLGGMLNNLRKLGGNIVVKKYGDSVTIAINGLTESTKTIVVETTKLSSINRAYKFLARLWVKTLDEREYKEALKTLF